MYMENQQEGTKQKNSNLSMVLIAVIMILLFIFTHITYNTEDAEIANWLWYGSGLTILLGGYAYSYHGKGYRNGKWRFGLVLLITLGMLGLLWYATQLGHAFQH